MNPSLVHHVAQFLYQNAERCDQREWDDYLEDFDPKCEIHLPQWIDEYHYVTDPNNGLSYMYYSDRTGLEDRVFRLRTGKSAASTPLARTVHNLMNIRILEDHAEQLVVKLNWNTFYYRQGLQGNFYGYATYHLNKVNDSYKIAKKHIVLLNDKIDSVLDFYHI